MNATLDPAVRGAVARVVLRSKLRRAVLVLASTVVLLLLVVALQFSLKSSPQIKDRMVRGMCVLGTLLVYETLVIGALAKAGCQLACMVSLPQHPGGGRAFPAPHLVIPATVMGYLNTPFPALINIVNEHDGIVNKFLGDGFMAVFGAPVNDLCEVQLKGQAKPTRLFRLV